MFCVLQQVTKDEAFRANALGWCIEWVSQAKSLNFVAPLDVTYPLTSQACGLCSCKPSSLLLTTSWTTLSHGEVSRAGTGCPRYTVHVCSLHSMPNLALHCTAS